MTDVQLSIGASEIIGAIVSVAGSYVAWSAKRVLAGLEQGMERQSRIAEAQEKRLDRQEHCLTVICANHELNHDQHVDCRLID